MNRDFALRTVGGLLAILLPLIFMLTSLRLLLTDAFVQLEYRTPNFPPDPYGFTLEDRLHWAPIALEYLLVDDGIEFLADLRFDDGQPVYNARELRHMEDVKALTSTLLRIWFASLATGGLAVAWLAQADGWDRPLRALGSGSRWTIYLMAGLGVVLAVSFTFLFIGFHRLFFEGTTWMFPYSDTLIRLFPEQFWRDTFIAFIGLTLLQGLLGWYLSRRFRTGTPP